MSNRDRAAAYRRSATLARAKADRIDAAIARPHRIPAPAPIAGLPDEDDMLAYYAHVDPHAGTRAAAQWRDIAAHWDTVARDLTRPRTTQETP